MDTGLDSQRDLPADWSVPLAGVQRQLFSAHLILLNRMLRKSAMVDYAEFASANLLERRIIFALTRIERARVSELATLLGNDIAQISRTLSALKTQRLVTRERQRDPYELTPAGLKLGEQMDKIALRREHDLAAGMKPLDMFELAGMLDNLTRKAISILTDEMARMRDVEEVEDADAPGRAEIASRIQPAVAALSTTVMRAATLAFKRLTGLSNYEWRVLAIVADRQSPSFSRLVEHVDSDKAQLSRALGRLIEGGMLRRTGKAEGRQVHFEMTAEGRRVHDTLRADALRRNAIMIEDLTEAQRSRLMDRLHLLIENATLMSRRAQGE